MENPGRRRAHAVPHDQRTKISSSVAWTSRAAEELQRFADSAAHREFLAEGEVFLPEMSFSHPRRPEEWMEGIMDLVVLTRGGEKLWIVDWKNGPPPPVGHG